MTDLVAKIMSVDGKLLAYTYADIAFDENGMILKVNAYYHRTGKVAKLVFEYRGEVWREIEMSEPFPVYEDDRFSWSCPIKIEFAGKMNVDEIELKYGG